ncbi:hypothetical protein JCM33374_g3183 [Metschnikowia sp. JCM 33374]|nr:hypothetical protein JCM33374_g3183 [Metschnikowia sp. JCM 33374]
MSSAVEKRRKTEAAPKQASRIFSPFRALGNVTNEIPFAVGSLGATFYLVTSVGRSFQIYDAANLHLLFVSQHQTPSKISVLTAHFHYVYAGYANKVGVYKRGRLEAEVAVQLSSPTATVSHVLVFGEYLVVASTDGDINVFKKPAGGKIATEHYTTIKSINPQFDGAIVGMLHPPTYLNKVVVATTNGVFVINVRTAKTVYKTAENVFGEPVSCIEHAPALDIIAVGTAVGGAFLFHLKKGVVLGDRIVASPRDVAARVTSLSFRTDGFHHLVAALNTGDLFFYDLAKRAKAHVYRNCHAETTGGVSKVAFLNGQPVVVTNGADNQLRELVFDPPLSTSNSAVIGPPRHLRSRGGHSAPPVSIAFPNEEKSHFIYSASKDQSLWCFSMRKDAQAQELSQRPAKTGGKDRSGGVVASMREKFAELTSFSMSVAREGDWENMVSTHKGEAFARTWDTKNKRVGRYQLATVDGGIAKATCVSHCGNFALVGSAMGGIGVYNLQSGRLRRKYMLHKQKAVTGLAIDGMNRKMVSCGLDGIVGFYNFADSKYLGKLDLEEPITEMIYHKGSDLVACALDDLSIVVIDVVTQKVVRILYGHTNRITGLDFSPDGRWVVSVSLDGTLRTWDLPTGGCIDGIRLPSVATSVKFSPIGDFLATTHVSGNGISLWTNRAQFHPVSTRHIEESEFCTAFLPSVSGNGGSLMIDGALDGPTPDDELDINQIYHSVDQIDKDLVTLSVGPRTRYETILHVDTIKQRNKPKEAPKKPEQAPFFLSLSGEAVGDRAVVAENGATQTQKAGDEGSEESRLLKLKGDHHNFESEFTRLLREGGQASTSANANASAKPYAPFLDFVAHASPATLDLEIRSLNSFPPLTEMAHFVEALTEGLHGNTNFDTYQAVFGLFLKHHGDVVYANPDDELVGALEKWGQANQNQEHKLDELVKFCSGVVDFVSAI